MTATERRAVQLHIDHAKRARSADRCARQAEAAKTAAAIWQSAVPAIAHPYLKAKTVRAHGVRIDGDYLVIPVRDAAGTIRSLQTVSPNGEKRFLAGGRVRGCYHSIGRPGGSITICEGYATAATIHEATQGAVAVAFNAGNLELVARALRAKYPRIGLVIAADDDWRTEGNPGLTAARRAAYAVAGTVVVPNFAALPRGERDSDFNDLMRLVAAAAPDARQAVAGARR
jgi:putative DNA primase/helicase